MEEKIRNIISGVLSGGGACDVFVPAQKEFGHYATNVALRAAKSDRVPPLAYAEELVRKIRAAAPKDFFVKIEVAPPGFINFWLSKETIQEEFRVIARQGDRYGKGASKKKSVIVEYSQPNIAKRLHVGHLRTTIIGDALANIYSFLGHRVVRWNYLGDWGTQFGKVIAAYKLWGDKEKVKKQPIETLAALYVKFHEEAARDPKLEASGQDEFRKLEEGDRENRRLWKWFRKESLVELRALYRILGVKFDVWIGESFFEKEMRPLVAELLDKGIAARSEGSVIVPLQGKPIPALIQKSDGASLYLTRDLANLRYRITKYKPEKILYVVGNEQSLHFEQLFAVARIVGITGSELVHVKYGLVLGEDAKKLATREGKVVLLRDVLEKAIRLARDVVEKKNPSLSQKEKERVAHVVGVGALKYNDLKENRRSDVTFDWKKMLDFSGDSGPYIQYTYTRLRSIEKKAAAARGGDVSLLATEEELLLMRKLFDFPGAVERCAEEYLTNPLATYLYELATCANVFYETTPIIKDENAPRRNARLLLVRSTAHVLQRGLELLGIATAERM